MKISIVIPCLNSDQFIEETILGILNQESEFEKEIIVIDGESTDNTLKILEKFSDRISYVSRKDETVTDALNDGFEKVTGDICAWIGSDDYYNPGAFNRIEKIFKNNKDLNWCFGKINSVDENGESVRRLHMKYKHFLMRNYSYPLLLMENMFAQPSVFFKTDFLKSFLPIDNSHPKGLANDYELWLRMGKKTKPYFVDQVLANFRYHSNSMTMTKTKELFEWQLRFAVRYGARYPWAVWIHRILYFRNILLYNIWKL